MSSALSSSDQKAEHGDFDTKLVREQFVLLIARVLGDFRPYLKGRRGSGKGARKGGFLQAKRRRRSSMVELFARQRFINDAPRESQEFLSAMSETQMFQAFIEQYCSLSGTGARGGGPGGEDALPKHLHCFERVVETRSKTRKLIGGTSFSTSSSTRLFPLHARSEHLYMTPAPSQRGIGAYVCCVAQRPLQSTVLPLSRLPPHSFLSLSFFSRSYFPSFSGSSSPRLLLPRCPPLTPQH